MSKLYLQNIVEDISFENLPIKWQGFDLPAEASAQAGFARFSKDKTLFDFQQNALKNALRGLRLFFEENTPSLQDAPLQEGNDEVEFEDGEKVNIKQLDYKLIKPLIWWE